MATTTTTIRIEHDGQDYMWPCRAFQPLDNPCVETIVRVVGAVKGYLLMLVCLLWAYAWAFWMLYSVPDSGASDAAGKVTPLNQT